MIYNKKEIVNLGAVSQEILLHTYAFYLNYTRTQNEGALTDQQNNNLNNKRMAFICYTRFEQTEINDF